MPGTVFELDRQQVPQSFYIQWIIGFLTSCFTPKIKAAARVIATLYFLGYASIPVGVMTGIIRLSSMSL